MAKANDTALTQDCARCEGLGALSCGGFAPRCHDGQCDCAGVPCTQCGATGQVHAECADCGETEGIERTLSGHVLCAECDGRQSAAVSGIRDAIADARRDTTPCPPPSFDADWAVAS